MDFYIFLQLIVVSIAATSAMTLFSYVVSESFRELYKEPVLLTLLINKTKIELTQKSKATLAWLLHYLIGFLFVLGYHIVWTNGILSVSPLSALIFGVISGIIGIIGWMFIFKVSHHQPSIDFKGYYIQLFFAHVIFALVATAIYYLCSTVLTLTKAYVTI